MKRNTILFISIMCLFLSCKKTELKNEYNIVPYPNSLEAKAGQFLLNEKTKIVFPKDGGKEIQRVVFQFTEEIEQTLGVVLPKKEINTAKRKSINFILDEEKEKEAYSLEIKRNCVVVKASGAVGFHFAIQTIKQLFPIDFFMKDAKMLNSLSLPCVEIDDSPRFGYRGMHLDVVRHFFDVDEVKKYIDILSFHKLNTFHWHLTDDQGWRIEIKKYPRLTEIGSIRHKTMIRKEWDNYDTTPYGGFFTQDEIREVVNYAAERFINVIPEIDLPGHMIAALAVYPELGCTGGPYEVSGQWRTSHDVLCAGEEKVFDFIEGVLSEVMELFPSEYIHIGGDECPKDRWEKCAKCQKRIEELGLKSDEHYKAEHYLQSYVITRVSNFLRKNGRKVIGWDEILEGGLPDEAIVMSWRGIDGGIEAARKKHEVIMTPNTYLYFDYYQSKDIENEPLGIGNYVPLEHVYSLEPVPEALNEDERKYIIGVQANLWAEYIATNEHLEYMLLPRLAALSEVQWTLPENKNWERFLESLNHIVTIYDKRGYNYAKHFYKLKSGKQEDS